ncbi:MAG: hypothetical protein KKD77_22825 [Gammaproteobacteria bacterium]|nr:hypothetical protein [Gammaproteobacteria bacterium]
MLTIEQVKRHSQVSVVPDGKLMTEDKWISSKARILYLFDGLLHKLYIKAAYEEIVSYTTATEIDIRETIPWEIFTNWINKHDDITENHLLTAEEWVIHHSDHPEARNGRDGCLDLIKNTVVDYSKIVFV